MWCLCGGLFDDCSKCFTPHTPRQHFGSYVKTRAVCCGDVVGVVRDKGEGGLVLCARLSFCCVASPRSRTAEPLSFLAPPLLSRPLSSLFSPLCAQSAGGRRELVCWGVSRGGAWKRGFWLWRGAFIFLKPSNGAATTHATQKKRLARARTRGGWKTALVFSPPLLTRNTQRHLTHPQQKKTNGFCADKGGCVVGVDGNQKPLAALCCSGEIGRAHV